MTVIKIGHNGHTRKISHEGVPPSWEWLSTKISELYKIPKDDVALSYMDSENDQVTLSTEDELHDYFTNFMRPGEVARFTVQRVSSPAVRQVVEDAEGEHSKEVSKEATPSDDWQNVETIPNNPQPDTFAYEEMWRTVDGINGQTYIPFFDSAGLNLLAAIGVAHPGPMADPPRPFSRRSTATLIKVATEKDEDGSEADDAVGLPPEATEKGKSKLPESDVATPVHVDSARSVRGSEADPATLDPSAHKEMVNPAKSDLDPPLPTMPPVPAPELAAAGSVPNIAEDLSQMLQAISNAFTTHPELSEGVRRVIRLATDNNYLESERRRLIQSVNDAVSEATVAARNGVDDASTGLNDALQGIFDALQNGLAAATAAAAYEDGRHHHHHHRRGRRSEPVPGYQLPAPPFPPQMRGPRGSRRDRYYPPPGPPGSSLPPQSLPEQAIHIQPPFSGEAVPFGVPGHIRQGSRVSSGSGAPPGAYPGYGPPYYASIPEPEITVTPQPWGPGVGGVAPAVAPAVPAPSSRDDAIHDLSERKTALEIAKENYRKEKEKWREEKEARRRARDQEIERITGRRVLSREERRAREREELEREEEENRRQDLDRARAERRNFMTESEVDGLERHRPTRGPTNSPEKVLKSPVFRGILNQTEQAFTSPTPRPATMTSPPPYVGARPRLPSQAERLMDQLEDMGFNPNTHPRLQDIVIENTKGVQRRDEDAMEAVLAALAELAPSSSRPRDSIGAI